MASGKPTEIRHGFLSSFGKARAGLEDEIDRVNAENEGRAEADDLNKYKLKFLQIDADGSGDLNAFELLTFLNACGLKDEGKVWSEPKVKEKVIKKFGDGGENLRYAGFLKMLLGEEMGRVLRLKVRFFPFEDSMTIERTVLLTVFSSDMPFLRSTFSSQHS